MMYIMLLVGFALLIKGADWFVEGSSSVAKLLRVPSVVIGLTIVAMGTSAPEAAVSITAGLTGNNDIALSNVIGSNLFNLLVVVGVCALLKPFVIDKMILKRDYLVCIGASLLLFVCMLDGRLSQAEGLLLLAMMALYLFFMVKSAISNRTEQEEQKKLSPLQSGLFILIGIIAIVMGGDLVVDNACAIATSWGLSQTLIGLTIVAIGTSLPELVTSIVAAKKGESGLALGNVVGSNIFNILFIMGMSSGLHVISVSPEALIDIVVSILVTVVYFAGSKIKGSMGRTAGIVSIGCYVVYTVYIIMR